ncbi:MAG: DUF1150 family protein [Pseudomonadota bacterium]
MSMKKTPAKAQSIVYVREVKAEDLPDEIRDAPGPFYAVFDTKGRRLGLATGRDVAFAMARRNDLHPVSVH